MRKLLLLLFLIPIFCLAQPIVKMRASSFTNRYVDVNNSWTDWEPAMDCTVLSVFDEAELQIKIHSDVTQVYDITSSMEETMDDGTVMTSYDCIDSDGRECEVWITNFCGPNWTGKIIVFYDNAAWAYAVKLVR